MKHWRIHIVFLLIILFGAAITGRLVVLQIVNQGFYKALAQGQQNFPYVVKGERGSIFAKDKQGNLITLATNQTTSFVFVSPPEVENKQETAIKLSAILQIPESVINEKLNREESLFEVLLKNLSIEREQRILSEEMPGVYIKKESMRIYPQATSVAHLLGFTNQDGKGQYGVEEQYQEYLKGKEGLLKQAKNPGGYLIENALNIPEDGSDIILTIDYNIQTKAEELLNRTIEDLNAREGTVIIMNPITGKIIAMATAPSFNPNSYATVQDFSIFQNFAFEKIFEPGSIFKPITMSSAMDSGKVTPTTTYEDKGILYIGGYTIENYDKKQWGSRTMTEVLEYSINTGAVFAERQLGHRDFLSAIERFGIFKRTGIDLPGEVSSENKELRKGYEINFATASFGQGIEMTPIQIVRAFSALANGGKLVNPYIVEEIVSPNGTVLKVEHDNTVSSPISPKTASQITSMLVSVIEHGAAKSAGISGYYIAGKTGTAQIPFSALGIPKAGYSEETNQSFIGYFPAFNPRFLVLVLIKSPETRNSGFSAVPLFKKLAKYVIDYYQIPPDYLE